SHGTIKWFYHFIKKNIIELLYYYITGIGGTAREKGCGNRYNAPLRMSALALPLGELDSTAGRRLRGRTKAKGQD
ncbi:MAG: hypothetical protein J6K94_02175, partial [Ruminiclostridium sp.]|nr:hypothetical protein [Ruminiclostridium sp.]